MRSALANTWASDCSAGQVPLQLCKIKVSAFTKLYADRATGASALTTVDLIDVLYKCFACVAWRAGEWQMPVATLKTQTAAAAAAAAFAQLLDTLAM